MITQRSEYKIADVTAVPSITGDIIPVRDGTGGLPVLKMEDIAFLVEAFCERGLAYSNPPYVDCPAVVFPPKVQTMEDIIGPGWRLSSGGVTRVLYCTGGDGGDRPGKGYGADYRLCYPLRELSTLPTLEENWWWSGDLMGRFITLAPTAFYYKDELPVSHEYFATHPVGASADLMRRLFYILKLTPRWLVKPVAADERWGGLKLSGTATYTEDDTYGDGTVLTFEGSQSYSEKTQNDVVRVVATNDDLGHRERLVNIYPRFGFTLHCSEPPSPGSSSYTTDYTRIAGITDAVFKTRIRYKTLATFVLIYVVATGSCKRSSAQQFTDPYWVVRRVECHKIRDIEQDPDGWVQEWALYGPGSGLTPMELRSFALGLGYSAPVRGTWGELTVETLTDLLIDGIPDWRTEIDSTGWDWEPPE